MKKIPNTPSRDHSNGKLVPVICGPTAAGKTDLAIKLCHELAGEVISADSRQVYRHMNIGTAKPTRAEQKQAKHHMIDLLLPGSSYSAGRYAKEAGETIKALFTKGVAPIIAGGSGLYIRSLCEGIIKTPAVPKEIRTSVNKELKKVGPARMHGRLKEIDAVAAKRINPNDWKKICRAIEVWEATGVAFSQILSQGQVRPPWRPFYAYIDLPRQDVYERINKRVISMVAEGLFEEVEKLLGMGYDGRYNAMNTVGYKEGIQYIRGETGKKEAIELIQRNTRRYAKRQITWFNQIRKDYVWVPGRCEFRDLIKAIKDTERNSA